MRELGVERLVGQEEQEAARGGQVELGGDALAIPDEWERLALASVRIPSLNAFKLRDQAAVGGVLDAGVDQEQDVRIGKLAAVVEEDAFVSSGVHDMSAVALLVEGEVADEFGEQVAHSGARMLRHGLELDI